MLLTKSWICAFGEESSGEGEKGWGKRNEYFIN